MMGFAVAHHSFVLKGRTKMNHLTSTMSLRIQHSTMTDEQFAALMLRIVRTAKGRSQREISIVCGEHSFTDEDLWQIRSQGK